MRSSSRAARTGVLILIGGIASFVLSHQGLEERIERVLTEFSDFMKTESLEDIGRLFVDGSPGWESYRKKLADLFWNSNYFKMSFQIEGIEDNEDEVVADVLVRLRYRRAADKEDTIRQSRNDFIFERFGERLLIKRVDEKAPPFVPIGNPLLPLHYGLRIALSKERERMSVSAGILLENRSDHEADVFSFSLSPFYEDLSIGFQG